MDVTTNLWWKYLICVAFLILDRLHWSRVVHWIRKRRSSCSNSGARHSHLRWARRRCTRFWRRPFQTRSEFFVLLISGIGIFVVALLVSLVGLTVEVFDSFVVCYVIVLAFFFGFGLSCRFIVFVLVIWLIFWLLRFLNKDFWFDICAKMFSNGKSFSEILDYLRLF